MAGSGLEGGGSHGSPVPDETQEYLDTLMCLYPIPRGQIPRFLLKVTSCPETFPGLLNGKDLNSRSSSNAC